MVDEQNKKATARWLLCFGVPTGRVMDHIQNLSKPLWLLGFSHVELQKKPGALAGKNQYHLGIILRHYDKFDNTNFATRRKAYCRKAFKDMAGVIVRSCGVDRVIPIAVKMSSH